MNTNSLEAVQATLNERGARDVKFLFKRESVAVPATDLEEDLSDVLSKFLAGRYSVAEKLPSEELTNNN
ncbi:MAG: hypothetical protein WAT12_15865 [Candidatus Nitrotoga sp.]